MRFSPEGPRSSSRAGIVAAIGTFGMWLLACTASLACSTPVYRYAMYNWVPTEYVVFYLHRGQEAEQDKKVNEALKQLAMSEVPRTNVIFESLDLTKEDMLERMPYVIQEACKQHKGDELPIHLVITPHGRELHAGRLMEADVKAFADSPARQKLARLLAAGRSGVLIQLLGAEKPEADVEATKQIQEAVRIAKEEFAQFAPPDDANTGLKVGLLKVDRKDPKEQWLVRMLMAIEQLEAEDRQHPMVFASFGRGRALEPYIGAGIEANNLLDVIAYVNGACSCEIKEQNPGMDLVCTFDWDAAAMEMAQEVGEETGNRALLQMALLGPPPEMAAPAQPDDQSEETTVAQSSEGPADESSPESAKVPADTTDDGTTDRAAPGEAESADSKPQAPSVPTRTAETDLSSQMIVKLMGGIGVVFALVVIAGLVLIRMRRLP